MLDSRAAAAMLLCKGCACCMSSWTFVTLALSTLLMVRVNAQRSLPHHVHVREGRGMRRWELCFL